jgi:hypothetical protein
MTTAEQKLALFTDKDFGGPASVLVIEDQGKTGSRATNVLLSYGDPSTNQTYSPVGNIPLSQEDVDSFERTPQSPQKYDLAINLNPNDAGYLDVYYYAAVPPALGTGNMWYNVLALTPTTYAFNKTVTFNTSGQGLVTVDIPKPAGFDQLTPELKAATMQGILAASNINYNFESLNPVAGLVSAGNIREDGDLIKVDITLGAAQYVSSNWVPVVGDVIVHLLIGLVSNN